MNPQRVSLRQVALADHETEVLCCGEGPPTVLLHSVALDKSVWTGVMARGRRRFIAYDLRGHGSAAAAPASDDISTYASDLEALANALGLGAFHLAGLSFGGAVAQAFSVVRPERVASLDLFATMSAGSPAIAERADLAQAEFDEAIVPTLTRWLGPLEAAAPDHVLYAEACLRRAASAHWKSWWRALGAFDGRAALSGLSMPVRVVAGGADASTPPEAMAAMARAIPAAQFHVLPELAHLIPLTAAATVAELFYS